MRLHPSGYFTGGLWGAADYLEDARRRYTSMFARASRGAMIAAVEWSRIAVDLRSAAAREGLCGSQIDDALRCARDAERRAEKK